MIRAYITSHEGDAFLYLNNGREGFVPIYIVSDVWETHVEDLKGIVLNDDEITRIIGYLENSRGDYNGT